MKYEKINDPIIPEYVFLGLIFVNFFPPIKFPNTYPPISVEMEISKMKINIILFSFSKGCIVNQIKTEK